MYRITTASSFDLTVATLQQRQQELVTMQQQLTSGKRVLQPSDDPTAAALSQRAGAMLLRASGTQTAVNASQNAMQLTESALSNATDLIQQARELVVGAGNASYSDADRASTATQLQSLRDQLLSVANTTNGSGGYVFSGQGASQQPFLDAPGGVGYNGAGGSVMTASVPPLPLTMDGNQVWLQARSGNGVFATSAVSSSSAWIDGGQVTAPGQLTNSTYTVQFSVSGSNTTYSILKDGNPTAVNNAAYGSGQAIQIDGMSFVISGAPAQGDTFQIAPSQPNLSIFSALDATIKALKTPNITPSQVTQAVQTGLGNLDAAANSIQSAQSYAGQMLNNIDQVQNQVDSLTLYGKTQQSDSTDLDMVSAISSFQSQQTGYQAALQSYAAMQKLSLFNYLGG
jgi:flagellar hook-associated protein 3 FlgL